MSQPLNVLIIEDSASDAALMLRHLAKAGFDVSHERVESADALREALGRRIWDVLLCDFTLPGFGAPGALGILKATGRDIPFIVVSGSIGDETAIELMRTGAQDYLMKDNLARLAPAIERELLEASHRLARRTAEEHLRLSARVFESADEGITLTDANLNIVAVNPAFEEITGYQQSEVIGKNPRILQSGRHDKTFYRDMWASLLACGHWSGEIWNRRKNGEAYPGWLTISTVRNEQGDATHYVGLFSDRSSILAARERVDFLSHHDSLTGLPNRALLRDRLQLAIDTAKAEGRQVALLLLNVDRLQRVNDAFGHDHGDLVLKELADRLNTLLAPGDTLSRLGSDEFVMLLTHFADADEIILIGQRLLEAIARPFHIQSVEVTVTASMGIALYPGDGLEPVALLKCADTALSMVKNEGSNGMRFFTAEMNTRALSRMTMENQLRHAIERDELLLHYQPQVALGGGGICGVEALIRWRDPELGLISPADFIPLAEDTGLIHPIGEWVIRMACLQNKAWQDAGLSPVRMAVNISAHQMTSGLLLSIVQSALKESSLDPHYLEIELTESALMKETELTQRQIAGLRAMGVSISLDDFGTGYSSLGYLSRFTLDRLKIDQGFVANITTEPRSAAIAKATIALAQSLGMTVIAEGVETEGQLGYLRKLGCDEIQGYLFSRPIPVDEMALLLNKATNLFVNGVALEPSRTLLLLDDEPHVLSSLQRLLRRDGYQILVAHSSRQAFEQLATHSVHVVISDQRMPDMNGTEFLERVSELYPETVRMVLSGYNDLDTVTSLVNRGEIYKFLSKPWDDDALRETVREAFRKAEREKERQALSLT